jgi:hypothetical protein
MDKNYWAQWKSHPVTSGILERIQKLTDGQSKISQIILPQSRVNNVLNKPRGELSGGHLGVTRPCISSGKGTTGFRQEMMLRSDASSATSVQPAATP